MKIAAYNLSSLYEDKLTQFNGCKVSLNDSILTCEVCIFDTSGRAPLTIDRREKYEFDLNQLLSLSEDHGYILVSSEQRDVPEFKADQVLFSTFYSKSIPLQFGSDRFRLFWLITPYKGCSLEDATLLLTDDGHIDLSELTVDEYVDTRFRAYQPIVINAPQVIGCDQSVDIDIVQTIPGTSIRLEASSGVLNRTRLDRSGSVRLTAQGLDPGEQITIKAGYKYWTSDTEHIITVVE
jgi:hypothetical protein